jgi:DNA (cytosine-5)-methyltransferase 1
MNKVSCVDLFCGAGGLTHGFIKEGIPVVAGIDIDPACRFPYEANNNAKFVERDISKITTAELNELFGNADLKILAGCAPCQPFSTYAQRYEIDGKDGKWGLLYEFARLAKGTRPDIITMENVPTVAKHEVFRDFVDTLKRLVNHQLYCGEPDSVAVTVLGFMLLKSNTLNHRPDVFCTLRATAPRWVTCRPLRNEEMGLP